MRWKFQREVSHRKLISDLTLPCLAWSIALDYLCLGIVSRHPLQRLRALLGQTRTLSKQRLHLAQDQCGSCSFACVFFLLGLQLPMGAAVLRACNHQPSRRLQTLNNRLAGQVVRCYGFAPKFLKKIMLLEPMKLRSSLVVQLGTAEDRLSGRSG